MDITGINVAAIAGLIGTTGTAVVSVIKAIQACRKASDADRRLLEIELAREQTKKERDQEIKSLRTEVEVLKALHKETKERLAESTNQFKALDDKVDTTNNLLNQIVGALKNSGLRFNGGDL